MLEAAQRMDVVGAGIPAEDAAEIIAQMLAQAFLVGQAGALGGSFHPLRRGPEPTGDMVGFLMCEGGKNSVS
jgi:hypothetical protein